MDSDTESDGSHVSATPPRSSGFSADQERPQQPPQLASDASSFLSRSNCRSNSKSSNLIKASEQQPHTHGFVQEEPIESECCPTVPFRIIHSSNRFSTISTSCSVETLPAGFFLNSMSSNTRHLSFTPDSVEHDFSSLNDESNYRRSDNMAKPSKSIRTRKHPNFVGPNVPLPQVKMVNHDDGNFVKLNMYQKRKNRKKAHKSSRKKSFRAYRFKSVKCEDSSSETVLLGKTVDSVPRHGVEIIEELIAAIRCNVSDLNLAKLLKAMYGYDSFRDKQLDAIRMVLNGDPVMLVLPTGMGKSLCYQIPAVILPGVTVVVSPLLALMIDQLASLPSMVQGGLLCCNQSSQEITETLRLLKEGSIKVLFISPERFLSTEFQSISSTIQVSLLVVDEAHCVSEWSHSFRPSYMRLRASVLRSTLNFQRVIAMTATATTKTLGTVMSALEIPLSNLVVDDKFRDNLKLSISVAGNRMKDLLKLLKASPYKEAESIIIYCKFQSEADIISRYLCDNNILAKSYHSSISFKERHRTQELFCSNKIRVVAATVAFGMGLDKRDVGAVIHYSLPESLEEYVQEIGRAGRDGSPSYCHLFFDDMTYLKIRSLMHSDSVDENNIRKFLFCVFNNKPSSCQRIYSLIRELTSRKFDMKDEVILTIITQLEVGEVHYIHLLPHINATCTLNFHKTSASLLAEKHIFISMILKRSVKKGGNYVFDVATVADSIGVTPADLINNIQRLQLLGEVSFELKDPAYCYLILEVPSDLCELAAQLTRWLSDVERSKVYKLNAMYSTTLHAIKSCDGKYGCQGLEHTPCMKKRILEYFKEEEYDCFDNERQESSPFLRADIKVFLRSNSHVKFTPRAVARILHGISSPAYPSSAWSKSHFWGRYTNIDFPVVMEAAKAELKDSLGKGSL